MQFWQAIEQADGKSYRARGVAAAAAHARVTFDFKGRFYQASLTRPSRQHLITEQTPSGHCREEITIVTAKGRQS